MVTTPTQLRPLSQLSNWRLALSFRSRIFLKHQSTRLNTKPSPTKIGSKLPLTMSPCLHPLLILPKTFQRLRWTGVLHILSTNRQLSASQQMDCATQATLSPSGASPHSHPISCLMACLTTLLTLSLMACQQSRKQLINLSTFNLHILTSPATTWML